MTARMDYSTGAPDGITALGSVHGYVSQCGLPATLVHLGYLRVSLLNGCAYCIDLRSRDLLRADVPLEKMLLVSAWDEAGSFLIAEHSEARTTMRATRIAWHWIDKQWQNSADHRDSISPVSRVFADWHATSIWRRRST